MISRDDALLIDALQIAPRASWAAWVSTWESRR